MLCPSAVMVEVAVGAELFDIVTGNVIERVAEEVAERFPQARAAVLSSDLFQSARALKATIADIAQGGADIIIGTQIVAKGHNFPGLTLVGVIDADLGLQGADLRAAERSFQLMRQVAGRAGRQAGDRPGVALLLPLAFALGLPPETALILLAAVLVITYWPELSLALVR